MGGPLWLSPLEFLTLRFVHSGLPATHQLQCSFPYTVSGPWGGTSVFCLWVSLIQEVVILCICLSLQFGGSTLPCDLTSLTGLRRVVDVFISFRFLLVVRMKCWPISSLHSEPETVSPDFFFPLPSDTHCIWRNTSPICVFWIFQARLYVGLFSDICNKCQ